MQNKTKFITDLLKPYLTGKREFSYEGDTCLYVHPNGTHCAFAMACKPERRHELSKYEDRTAAEVLYGIGDDILLPEAKAQTFTDEEWNRIQILHDTLANKSSCSFYSSLTVLEEIIGKKLTELRELSEEYFAHNGAYVVSENIDHEN